MKNPINYDAMMARQAIMPRRSLVSGRTPDPFLVKQLEVHHPFVKLGWESHAQRWALWEQVGSQFHFIIYVGGPTGEYQHPTWANTVGYLHKAAQRIHNQYALDEWLREGVDYSQIQGAQQIRKDARPQLDEGSDRIWRELNPRTVITKRW